MNLTFNNFFYLANCLEGFLFGELFFFTTPKALSKIAFYQASILAYLHCICNVMHPKKGVATTQHQILFSMLSVSYMSCLQFSLLLILLMFGLTCL